MNPHLHLAIHEVVANQLWDEEPPETWQTARRLDLLGYERHEVFHMIGSVVAAEIWQIMHDQQETDLDLLKEKLAACLVPGRTSGPSGLAEGSAHLMPDIGT